MSRRMEVVETKRCPNCHRDIPTVNFTIHNVHCSRNICMCPVCKEPVLQVELSKHHEQNHKLLPCKKCGESVCGTDLEDHIRDSCAHTIKTCRFCDLELPRRDLPGHESYCGVRTEQCPDCREWVMIKYRQLHLDSNHGFIRLDDDPAPIPKSNASNPFVSKLTNTDPSTSNGVAKPSTSFVANGLKNINLNDRPRTEIRYFNSGSSSSISSSSASSNSEGLNDWRQQSVDGNSSKVSAKRTNDQPQINTNVAAPNKVEKNLSISRGAVKKRPAPKPPGRSPPRSPLRDLPYHSALQRQQQEERDRHEQTAYNLSVGLPPVLNPAAKLEKLRKMDALMNTDNDMDHRSRAKGKGKSPINQANAGPSNENQDRRQEFKNLKPMSPQEFMERFSEIKSSLRELRRGLNEVTAPYHSNPNISANNNNNNGNERGGRSGRASPSPDAVRLPCEFCNSLIPAHNLVQHQTGCRPDLAQLRPRSPSPAGAAALARVADDDVAGVVAPPEVYEPVIPCEFCTQSLPVYLISEHQERCSRETNLLYPD
ncbi:uncharacterized protein LOC113502792 isoform X2 [Trichoplusia ni]|uniref:Uncharacterized protein LOC113502792 isoform X2 n=1 Tax=Trichoplusia ni TaxID=7111 RepID=A0A7E5WHX4_TRINI|nr:uncharacterized protein LOC113502792 isoform X2 [Trichoplusia ni]